MLAGCMIVTSLVRGSRARVEASLPARHTQTRKVESSASPLQVDWGQREVFSSYGTSSSAKAPTVKAQEYPPSGWRVLIPVGLVRTSASVIALEPSPVAAASSPGCSFVIR